LGSESGAIGPGPLPKTSPPIPYGFIELGKEAKILEKKMSGGKTNEELLANFGLKLTIGGQTQFTRQDLIKCVKDTWGKFELYDSKKPGPPSSRTRK
jgi:hypothetical protein